jgi:transcription initiation factor TFIID TATA-box-binding protein
MSQPPELKVRIKPSGSGVVVVVKDEPGQQTTRVDVDPNQVDIAINNVVCSYSTSCYLNLRRIAMEGMHVEFKKENNMVNMRLRSPLSTASIWSSGKITCTGATTEPDAYKAARRYCRILQKMKFKVRLANYRVVNVLATCSMPFGVDIYKIASRYQKECSYEPELHPGATFRLKDLHATLKLFNTGSITLTAPSVSKIVQAIEAIYPILYENRRQDSTSATNANAQSTTSVNPAAVANSLLPESSILKQQHNHHQVISVVSNGGGGYNNSSSVANIAYAAQNCSREFKIENYGGITNYNYVMMTGGMGVSNSNTSNNNNSVTNPLHNSFNFDHLLNTNSAYTNINNNAHLYSNPYNIFELQAQQSNSSSNVNSNASSSSSTLMGGGSSGGSSSSIGFEFNNGGGYSTNGNGLNNNSNGSIHLISSGSAAAHNSASLFGSSSTGGSNSTSMVGLGVVSAPPTQPYHWFNENVLVDNMFEDFLP